jgi:hypothetical protein
MLALLTVPRHHIPHTTPTTHHVPLITPWPPDHVSESLPLLAVLLPLPRSIHPLSPCSDNQCYSPFFSLPSPLNLLSVQPSIILLYLSPFLPLALSTQSKFFPSFLTFKFSHFLIFAVSEEDCHVPKAYAHMRVHVLTCAHMILL